MEVLLARRPMTNVGQSVYNGTIGFRPPLEQKMSLLHWFQQQASSGQFQVHRPVWLILLLVVGVVYWISRKSLSGLGPMRQWATIAARSGIVCLLTLALAELYWEQPNEEICTVFLLDQSRSIPEKLSKRALDMVDQAIRNHSQPNDLAGVVAFGREAIVCRPPQQVAQFQGPVQPLSRVDAQESDLAAAIRVGRGLAPPGVTLRLVLLSDGNQNRGNALAEAHSAAAAMTPIDIVTLDYEHSSDVLVDSVVVTPQLTEGEPATVKVILQSNTESQGRVRVYRSSLSNRDLLGEREVALQQGLTVLTMTANPAPQGHYTYEAEFLPNDPQQDAIVQNNRAAAYSQVHGNTNVLLIAENAEPLEPLIKLLNREKFAVSIQSPDQIAWTPAYFRQFDLVVLTDVPAEKLSDEAQKLLAASVRQLGVGLIMAGSPNSFGAGGYFDTPIEEILPVRCSIQGTKVQPSLALVLVLDVSGSMLSSQSGPTPLSLAVRGAINCLSLLNAQSEAGIVGFSDKAWWVAKLQPAGNPNRFEIRMRAMPTGGGTNMYPAMAMAYEALRRSKAMLRHVVLLSDGKSQPGDFEGMAKAMAAAGITLSTVVVGESVDASLMLRLAHIGKGRGYLAPKAASIPRIYMQEVHRVHRPLIFEPGQAWSPLVQFPTAPVAGLPSSLPPIEGLVLTQAKETAEVPIVSPKPEEMDSVPVVAHWQAGLGRTAAVTTDIGQRWASSWLSEPVFDHLWSQLIRWTQRAQDTGELTLQCQRMGDSISIVVEAADDTGERLDFLQLRGTALLPDATTEHFTLHQNEPGKYTASVTAKQPGSYVITVGGVLPGGRQAITSSGLHVSYSAEYRDWTANHALLENIASITDGEITRIEDADQVNFFRRDRPLTVFHQPMWPVLLLSALVLFFTDVALRRVSLEELDPAVRRWLQSRFGKQTSASESAVMERLMATKRQAAEQYSRPAASDSIRPPQSPRSTVAQPQPGPRPPSEPQPEQPASEGDSFASRLLAAKRNVWKDR